MKLGKIDPWPYKRVPGDPFGFFATRGASLFRNWNPKTWNLAWQYWSLAKVASQLWCLWIFWPPGVQIHLVSETLKWLFGKFEGLIRNIGSGCLFLVSLKLLQASAYHLVLQRQSFDKRVEEHFKAIYRQEDGFNSMIISKWSKTKWWIMNVYYLGGKKVLWQWGDASTPVKIWTSNFVEIF